MPGVITSHLPVSTLLTCSFLSSSSSSRFNDSTLTSPNLIACAWFCDTLHNRVTSAARWNVNEFPSFNNCLHRLFKLYFRIIDLWSFPPTNYKKWQCCCNRITTVNHFSSCQFEFLNVYNSHSICSGKCFTNVAFVAVYITSFWYFCIQSIIRTLCLDTSQIQ